MKIKIAIAGTRTPSEAQLAFAMGLLRGIELRRDIENTFFLLQNNGVRGTIDGMSLPEAAYPVYQLTEPGEQPFADPFAAGVRHVFGWQLNLADLKIVTGCDEGLSAAVLAEAKRMGFHTVGCLPWPGYGEQFHHLCDELITENNLNDIQREEMRRSVGKYYGNSLFLDKVKSSYIGHLDAEGVKLHERNYLMVRWSHRVVAFPNKQSSGGGAGQCVRLAQGFQKPVDIVYPLLKKRGVVTLLPEEEPPVLE